ncbi:MAG: thioredoxin [Candidatus Gygaella obscura]|nr:thioredoxin [Candidatus Gygaella obscura]
MEINVSESNFKSEVSESKIPCLVDFWAEWCGPCKMIASSLEEIAQEYQGKIKVCKINVDEASSVASSYGIMSIPTLMVFKDGSVQKSAVGALSKADIVALFKAYI